jgi:hypothetical protein
MTFNAANLVSRGILQSAEAVAVVMRQITCSNAGIAFCLNDLFRMGYVKGLPNLQSQLEWLFPRGRLGT